MGRVAFLLHSLQVTGWYAQCVRLYGSTKFKDWPEEKYPGSSKRGQHGSPGYCALQYFLPPV